MIRWGRAELLKLEDGDKTYERAIEHLYPMELSYNKEGVNLKGNEFNVNAKEFQPRQNAVTVANFKIKGQNDDENDKK